MASFDVTSKLTAPARKSQFERSKAEAEAKKAREKAENLAALAAFEKSFQDDDDDERVPSNHPLRGAPAPGKRHFTSASLKSGPGSLPRSGPGSLGPAYNKKRPFDDYADRRDRSDGGGFNRSAHRAAYDQEKDEEIAARPTLHLASMPPASSATFIKQLFAHTPLRVDGVRILPSTSASSTERKSCAAIVTLAAETPASDIDTVVSHLQNKYLGLGFKLSISRHLSSAALSSTTISSVNSGSLPFGARPIANHASLSRAPPPGQRFAPPSSYTSSTPYGRAPHTQVVVQPPADLKQLKLIHKTIESLLTYGPEFEALLMARPEIQQDERWSWMWDSSSAGGVYYRWRLWEILTNASNRQKQRSSAQEVLFEGQSSWVPPNLPLRFEYTLQLEEFVSDDDYVSSDEEDEDGGRGVDLARRYNDHNTHGMTTGDDMNDGLGYLDPLAKAKLTHLLARLPDVNTRLRRGDVARITAFAIEHASAGGDEVAFLITRNVIQPFSKPEGDDTTAASMVGLYVVSDILSCSASAGVRHAWRYRTLFEQALRQQKVFEKLGRAEKDFKWGKLKGEKWKRSVQSLLGMWEGMSVFPQAAQEHFAETFLNPPLTEEEKKALAATEAEAQKDSESRSKSMNRWRSVEDEAVADVSMEDIDGTPLADDDDDENDVADSEMDADIDGVSMVDSSDEDQPASPARPRGDAQTGQDDGSKLPDPPSNAATAASGTSSILATTRIGSGSINSTGPVPDRRRSRPKAADMFADDSE